VSDSLDATRFSSLSFALDKTEPIMKRILVSFLLLLFVLSLTQLYGQNASPAVSIVRIDPAFDQLVPKDATLEKLTGGYIWTEGPVWDKKHGYLLFSDIPNNSIVKWEPGKGASLFLKPSGSYSSTPSPGHDEPGSNGLTFDSEGRLVIDQQGNRRISRKEADGKETVLADRYEGKRFNSPNDLTYKSNGDLYFTDPAYGLPKQLDDPQKELQFQGVYRVTPDGKVTLLDKELKAPNGITFSPDEKILYVNDSIELKWWAYDVQKDGSVSNKRLLLDGNDQKKNGPGTADGMKADEHGNLYSAGPGGILVISSSGKVLGRLDMGVPTSNCAWGEDGSTLYITANTNVYRIKLSTKGAGW
jgi:gluconolactonase